MLVIVEVINLDTGETIDKRETRLTEKGKLWLANFVNKMIAEGKGVQIYHKLDQSKVTSL